MAARPDRLGLPGPATPRPETGDPAKPKRAAQPRRGGCTKKQPASQARTPLPYKPTRVPPGFVLIVDTREQQPLFVGSHHGEPGEQVRPPGHPGLVVERGTLHDGDYAVKGCETTIVFERKKLSDFLSYVGKERRTRTEPKLARLARARFAALVIEEDEKKLAGPFRYSRLTGEHARAFLLSCRVRHGIHVYVSKDRAALERFILDHAIKAWLVMQEEKDNGKSR